MQTVKVLRRDDTSKPWNIIHRGIVVKETVSFVKVYNPIKTPGVYDADINSAEWFPKNSNCLKIE